MNKPTSGYKLFAFTSLHFLLSSWAKTKKLCGLGNPTLPTILVPTLFFFSSCKIIFLKIAENLGTVRYSLR